MLSRIRRSVALKLILASAVPSAVVLLVGLGVLIAYTEDVARALLAAAASRLEGARVYNLHGTSVAIAGLVKMIAAAWPKAAGLITHVEQPIPFPAALDDARYQTDLGPAPPTALTDGIKRTLDEFARLQTEGRLDARELA